MDIKNMRKFSEVYKFGTFEVEGTETRVPKVMLGTSPFIGAGQFGAKAMEYYSKFYLKPENMVSIILKCIELGANAVQAVAYEKVINAISKSIEISDTEIFVLGTVGLENVDKELEFLQNIGAKFIVAHGDLVDSNIKKSIEILKIAKEYGFETGVATHTPGKVIPIVENIEEVRLILAPINKIGRFMKPTIDSAMKAILNSSKPIIAIKPLAAGFLSPLEGLSFLSDKVKGIAVGITSETEAEETLNFAKLLFNR
ncbi:MAG: hypothetical protein AB1779_07355 [Candidatus Thermoplasmatota archaeon]